jgi:hypothetical protein
MIKIYIVLDVFCRKNTRKTRTNKEFGLGYMY